MGALEHKRPTEGRKSPPPRRKRRIIAAAALTAALVAGVLALTVPAAAQADSDDSGTGTSGAVPAGQEEREAAARERLAEALAPLLSDGTLTEDQRDAVVEQLVTARRALSEEGRAGGHHGRLPGGPLGGASPAELAGVLDLTPQELAERLRAGETLAEVAADAGVDPGAVVDVLVEGATERIDAAIEAGRLESEDRDACIASVAAAITAHVHGDDADRQAVGDSCGHHGDGDRDGKDRRRGRSALRRLQFWR